MLNKHRGTTCHCHEGRGVIFWGCLLVIIGLYLIALKMNLVGEEFPFWGVVIAISGIALLLRRRCE